MGRRPSLALLIIVAGAFFLIGLYTAFLQDGPSSGPQARTSPTPVRATPVQGQETTFLFLGVDNLQATAPELEAVWFMTFQPPDRNLFLLGIPLDTIVDGDPPQPLSESFAWEPQTGPSQEFQSRLYRGVPLEPDAIIVLDRTAFATAIDFVGGVTLNDTTFAGQEVLGILSLTDDDPQSSLSLQRRLLAALSASAASVGQAPELTPLIELIPQHMYVSRSIKELVAMVSPLLPITSENTHIETY